MTERPKREGGDAPLYQVIKPFVLTLLFFRSLFERRSPLDATASIHPRTLYAIPLSWCSPGTKTWVAITVFNAYARGSDGDLKVLELLTDTLGMVHNRLAQGDGVIPTGALTFARYGVSWYSANANNHQQTWGVLAGAIMALTSFMDAYGEFGYAHFEIFDGVNQVGSGSVGPG